MSNPQLSARWQLVLGLLMFAGMTAVLAAIAGLVSRGAPLTVFDTQLSHWFHTHRTASGTMFFVFVTYLGSTLVGSLVAAALGAYLLYRKRKFWFFVTMSTIFLGMLLNPLLKLTFRRARPQFDDPVFSFTGYSFPSGHTMTATVVYGTLALVVLAVSRRKADVQAGRRSVPFVKRAVVLAAAAVVILLVAFSRVYLGAHYLSDVLAAMAEGMAWLSLCFSAAYYYWRTKKRAEDHSPARN